MSSLILFLLSVYSLGILDGSADKESTCNARNPGDMGSIPGLERSPAGEKWQPTPEF